MTFVWVSKQREECGSQKWQLKMKIYLQRCANLFATSNLEEIKTCFVGWEN